VFGKYIRILKFSLHISCRQLSPTQCKTAGDGWRVKLKQLYNNILHRYKVTLSAVTIEAVF